MTAPEGKRASFESHLADGITNFCIFEQVCEFRSEYGLNGDGLLLLTILVVVVLFYHY